jgi:hypothetical protein
LFLCERLNKTAFIPGDLTPLFQLPPPRFPKKRARGFSNPLFPSKRARDIL